jgi:death on curing protein
MNYLRNHSFVDGYKRTGVAAAGLFLRRKGYRLTAGNASLLAITMKIAQSQNSLEELTLWFRDNSQPIE